MQTQSFFRLGQLVAPLSIATTMLLGFSAQASAISLGVASDYNVFILGDIHQSSTDIEGRLAVSGNVTLSNFGVGNKLSPNSGNVLVTGGDLNLTNMQVNNGDAVYGGILTSTNSNIVGGKFRQDNPIDFNAAGIYLRDLSLSLSQQQANGNTTIYDWGGISLVGTDSQFNVFNLTAAELAKANSFRINAAQGSTVVVNISGADVSMGGFEFFFENGITKQNVLYNFYEATTLQSNGLGIKGSILAANADFKFNNGHIDGNLIAKSLTGSGESHNYLFNGTLPQQTVRSEISEQVPEPTILAGLGLVAAMGVLSRRKGKQNV